MKKVVSFLIIIFVSIHIFPVNAYNNLYYANSYKIENTTLDSFDNIVLKIMEQSHFPSVSACIIKNNQVVWSKGYGVSNIEQNYMTSDNTIYGICSITKTITGAALMQLYDQELFKLDNDVNDYLPFNLRNPHFPEEPITFRMLLSHSSSLRTPNSYWNVHFYHYGGPPFDDYPVPWLEDCLIPEGIRYDSSYWDAENGPGKIGVYANVNFDIIAYLVELLSNEPFYEYCYEHIFKPLEMYDTSFNLSQYDSEELANPYNWDNEQARYRKNYNQVHLHYTAGGLYSSVLDMSHFMIAQMNQGLYNGTRILKESTVDEMHNIQPMGPSYGRAYGLAWLFESRSFQLGSRIISMPRLMYGGHGGAVTYGLRTVMQMKLSENAAIIFFINSDSFLYQSGWNGIQLLSEMFFLKGNSY